MITIGNSLIALGVLGAMLAGTPDASYARERQAHGTAVQKHQHHATYPSGYALYPRAGYSWYGPPTDPNPYVRPFLRWDPYGLRWDDAD